MGFQDGCKNYLTSNQLTVVTFYRRPMTEESEVATINTKPEEEVDLDKLY